jgi:quercetin dioxygenase-like cupin family protein
MIDLPEAPTLAIRIWQGGCHADAKRFYGFCWLRAMRDNGVCCKRGVGSGCAAGSDSRYTRKILSQTDGPTPGYVTILVEAELQPGGTIARHTHPGIESTNILKGSVEIPIQGQPTRSYKLGDHYQIPAGTPHAGGKPSDTKVRLATTYVVEKDKPLVFPA